MPPPNQAEDSVAVVFGQTTFRLASGEVLQIDREGQLRAVGGELPEGIRAGDFLFLDEQGQLTRARTGEERPVGLATVPGIREVRPEPTFFEISYVTNPPDPAAAIRPRPVEIPAFEIVSNPTIQLSEVRTRRFDIIDRASVAMRQEIMAAEDERVFAALDDAAASIAWMPARPHTFPRCDGATFTIEERVRWDRVSLETCRHGLLLMMVERMNTQPRTVWEMMTSGEDDFLDDLVYDEP